MHTRLPFCLVLVLVTGCASGNRTARPSPAPPELGPPLRYTCHRAVQPLTIDGRLDEPAWKLAAPTPPFVDIQGPHMPAPRFETRARMLWDDTYFYIAAEMQEPHVWGTLTEHDEIVFHDNDFEVFIDPDGDRREYYEIEINALNTIFDLLLVRTYVDGGPALHDWNCAGLVTASHIDGTLNDPSDTDAGWTIEMAIPWTTLAQYARCPAPPDVGDTWRVNFSRVEWRHRVADGCYERLPDAVADNWVWTPQGVINMHLPEHWGYVEFAE
ncbi:MAG: carbohydrate-binding family 9-like protein [Phycisphaerae bacterium]|nr:carbohydrate-binding family 9-like protein [Phycisphaerae bacterium]